MKTKIMIVILSLCLAGSAMAQDKVVGECFGTRSDMEAAQPIIDAAKLKNSQVVALLASVWAQPKGDDNFYIQHVINMKNTVEIRFYVDYTSLRGDQVRFYFIITGPEVVTHTTDWTKVKKNAYDYTYIFTTSPWKPGIYKLIVIAEPKSGASGAPCVVTSVFVVL